MKFKDKRTAQVFLAQISTLSRYVARYKFIDHGDHVTVEVKMGYEHAGNSPHFEHCNCGFEVTFI